MYNEVLPGFYLCRIGVGIAHYTVGKELYDKYHTMANGQSSSNIVTANKTCLPITHLLNGNVYNNPFVNIKLLNWEDVPLNYQQDACASNEAIRRKYHESIYGAQNNEMSQLKDKLFSLVDSTTGQLKHLVPTGTRSVSGGLWAHELVEKKLSSSSSEGQAKVAWGRPPSTSNFPIDDRSGSMQGYPLTQVGQEEFNKVNNNTNNSSMNFNNIPGLALNYGKLEAGRLAVSLGGEIAFKSKDGGYITIQTEGTEKTRVEVGDLKFDIDFYKLPTQDPEEGDIILLDNEFLIVGKKTNGETKFINPLTGATTNKLKRDNVLGMFFYTKIVSLFDMAGGKGVGLGGLDPMTLMLLSQGTGNSINGQNKGMDLGQMLLFSQLGGAKGGEMSSMLPLLMMSGGGGDMSSMLPLLLMNKNGGGLNLFGKKKIAPKVVAPKKRTPAKKTSVAKG